MRQKICGVTAVLLVMCECLLSSKLNAGILLDYEICLWDLVEFGWIVMTFNVD